MNPWSLFWGHGHSTTFGDYFKEGYVGAIADWWLPEMNALPAGAVVIEVGCGNGSLLPAMIRSGASGKYIGVDLANVLLSDVARTGLAESGIEVVLHSRTPAEQLPEPEASADLVASVFGIEYSNLDRSLAEVLRVLKPGGRFCALLHHAGSVVTAMSRRAIAEFSADDLREAIEALHTISTELDQAGSIAGLKASREAERSRESLNRLAQKYLGDTNPKTANATMFEFMTGALRFFKMLDAPSETRRQFIASLAAEHQASHERFRQMVSVALDADGIDKLKARLQELGFGNTTTEVLYNDADVLAWALRSQK